MKPGAKTFISSFTRTKLAGVLRPGSMLVVYLLAFIILDSRSRAFELYPGVVAWYPPDGLSFAMLLILGAWFLPALAIASLISNVFIFQIPQPFFALLGWTIFIALVFGLAAWFLLRRVRIDIQLRNTRDLLWMIVAAVVVSTILAWVSVSSSIAAGVIPQDVRFLAGFQWWTGEMIGILVLTPALLIHVMPHMKRFVEGGSLFSKTAVSFARPRSRFILQGLGILVAIYLAVDFRWPNDFHPFFLIAIPVIWIAIDHGLSGATIGNVLTNFGVTWRVQGHDHFDLVELGQLQMMMLVMTVASLLIGIIVSEYRHSEHLPITEMEGRRKKIVYELIVISVSAMAAWILEYTFDIYEGITAWEIRHNVTGVDETLVTILVLGLGSAVFSHRRWREIQAEIREREKAQTELHTLYGELEARVQERTFDLSRANELLQTEINERKHAEEAREQSEKRFRALVEHSMEEISLVSADGTLVFESPSTRRPLGYPPGSFIGHNLFELFHPDDRPAAMKLLEQVSLKPGSYRESVFRLRHQDGSWRWMEGTVTNLLDEPAVGALVINYRDVTERIVAELALRDSEERFRMLFATSPDALFLIDPNDPDVLWPILDCNDSACRMNGYSREEMIGQSIGLLNITPATFEEYAPGMEELRREKVVHREAFHRHKDGHVFPIEYSTTLFSYGGRELVLGIDRDITERRKAEEQIRSSTDELSALYELSRALADSNDLDKILELVSRRTVESVHATFARIALVERDEFVIWSAYPIRFLDRDLLVGNRLPIASMPYAQRVLEQDKPVLLSALNAEVSKDERAALLLDFAQNVALIPLRVHEFASSTSRILGLLMVGETRKEEREPFTAEKMRLARSIGDQAAIAIDKVRLFRDVQRSNIDLRLAYDATIIGWSAALDLRDKETEGHTQRVTEITLRLAKRMGFSEQELVHVRRGALLHDIGKMGVPDSVLLKPDQLTEEEWAIMRMHPVYAYHMLEPIAYLTPALDIPHCHHEKWDGTGYPQRLKAEDIPLSARIFAVVDVYDALTSDRPYRTAWPREKSLSHIREQSGTHFDPHVVEVFLQMVNEETPTPTHRTLKNTSKTNLTSKHKKEK
jgi:PAS domain S-box-containing protein